ncbi:MAG: DUF6090 family protein [Flavobacteriaceae bacterium]
MENKTGKYIKYAIGEIVLVFIGILIALQINNWNNNQKANIEEKEILESLYENLTLANQQSEALINDEKMLKQLLIRMLGIETNPNVIDRRENLGNKMKKVASLIKSEINK